MKVLLTGASGFVGSHVLDRLLADGHPTRVLLRQTSSLTHIGDALTRVETAEGSLAAPATLQRALDGVTHVIHCAGCTKALRRADYFEANEAGTRNLVEAANAVAGDLRRFVLVSSLAAAGPAAPGRPAREDDPPAPVSDYGHSKLAGEAVVRSNCRVPWVILRPPAVYGPRDPDFLTLFRAVQNRVMPEFGGGRQELSLVQVGDLARVIAGSLEHPEPVGRTYYVAHPEVVTSRALSLEIGRLMGRRLLTFPAPAALLWMACALAGLGARLRGRPGILSLAKYPELRAPSWACDASRLARETGLTAATPMAAGLRDLLQWYRSEGWLS
jgi:nucleoside-diphosphate-sugar epimerase